ncbi:DUF885 family protein [Phenylobacterium sp.]|uniref:DUF885 domain-containing protein n=1 Tax=Phenylobacterium sp. TaxID=1871053 RepID=UPI00272F4295|nr:DUF885 family protein [Phenylobacterium sp.]MDP1599617.1 DUF885 family protein [Phenylobacterium sp.]MDP3593185.1 DUF885 family protein [Phenylobacterium sp.]
MRLAPLAIILSLAATPALADDAALNKLVADYEAYSLSQDPLLASSQGDRAALSRLPDPSLAADVARSKRLKELQKQLAAIKPSELSAPAELNREFLEWTLERQIQRLAFDEARMPFSSDDGFDWTISYLASSTPMRTLADGQAWIDRLNAVPAYYRAEIVNARRGIKSGFTQPRSTSEQVLARAKAQAAAPLAGDPMLAPLEQLPTSIPQAEREALQAEALAVVRDKIRPAQAEFATFLATEYLPASRKQLGARSLPGGERYYAWLVENHTTTKLTPDQIHQNGLDEVARIRREMDGVIAQTGFKGDFAAFQTFLRTDPQFYATSRQDLLEKASEIAKRIDDQLPAWFATLPRLTYGVRPVPADVEADYTTGRYFSGNPKLGIAGGYMVNTYKLDQRGLYELPALTLHEAVPGHHLQIALSQEAQGVPMFRREADVSAFIEGWGLYAEKLGGEMGIYRNAYERFGRLSYEMWRACRLVADTGIHWKGWSLNQARACFTDNTALSPLNIEVELARYVSWPGQALAYKTGEMKIIALREKARAELGDKFDIRRFHDAMLLDGPMPLDLLERRIDAWIAAEKVG